jgi:hypothetical protein
MDIRSYSRGYADAIAILSYKEPVRKLCMPPPINVYKPVVEAYRKIDDDFIRDAPTRNVISGKCKRYGLQTVINAIEFFDKYTKESTFREEMRLKGLKHFFLFKLDEMVKLMEFRKAKEPTYRSIDDESQRLVDPFAK